MAYLSKLNWRFHEEKNALWSQVLRKKYLSQRRLRSSNERSLPSSRTWKALQKGKMIFNAGTRWSLGRDSDISFWFDNWTSEGPLRNLLHGPLTREEEELRIDDVATESGWNWCKISMVLPAEIYMEIKAMPYSRVSDEKDKLIWAATSNGEFNLTSAYKLATIQSDFVPPFNGRWNWKLNLLPKIQTFIWMCLHKSIATRECLAKRGLQVNPLCPLCTNVQNQSYIFFGTALLRLMFGTCSILKAFLLLSFLKIYILGLKPTTEW